MSFRWKDSGMLLTNSSPASSHLSYAPFLLPSPLVRGNSIFKVLTISDFFAPLLVALIPQSDLLWQYLLLVSLSLCLLCKTQWQMLSRLVWFHQNY